MGSESPVNQCHLLQISRELRDCIYDLVICFDPPTNSAWHYKDTHGRAGFATLITKKRDTHFSIPWVDLLLTCKAISLEMTDYLEVRSKLDKEEPRTWTLDLAGSRGRLKPALWRKIPCHPTKTEVLVTHIDFTDGSSRFWGCGGPLPIVRQLYQTLNRILHYGPAFGRQSRLLQPLKLKRLILLVAGGEDDYQQLRDFVRRVQHIGVLWGYIDSVQVIDELSHKKEEIEIKFVEDTGVPAYWDRYGFEWEVSTRYTE